MHRAPTRSSPTRGSEDRQGMVWNCLITLLLLATLSAVLGFADIDGTYADAAQALSFVFIVLFGLCALGALTDGLRNGAHDTRRPIPLLRDHV